MLFQQDRRKKHWPNVEHRDLELTFPFARRPTKQRGVEARRDEATDECANKPSIGMISRVLLGPDATFPQVRGCSRINYCRIWSSNSMACSTTRHDMPRHADAAGQRRFSFGSDSPSTAAAMTSCSDASPRSARETKPSTKLNACASASFAS